MAGSGRSWREVFGSSPDLVHRGGPKRWDERRTGMNRLELVALPQPGLTMIPLSLRIFAKPFVASLEGHTDGVYCLGRDPRRTDVVAGGGGDGGERLLALAQEKGGIWYV